MAKDDEKGKSPLDALFSKDSVLATGLSYLRDYPVLVFAVLVIVLLVAIVSVAGSTAETTRYIAGSIVVVAFLAMLLFALTTFGPFRSRSRMVRGTVVELRNLPPFDAETDDADAVGLAMMKWIGAFFEQTGIVIDKGGRQKVEVGDYFAVQSDQKQVQNLEGENLGKVTEDGTLLRVAEVYPKFSVCTLASWKYGDYDPGKRLAPFADAQGNIDIKEHLEALSPVGRGQEVIAIAKQEKALNDDIEEFYGRTLADDVPAQEKVVYYREMISKARDFLETYPAGFFAPHVLFQQGYAQFQLQKYDDSIETFERFLKRYPLHVSATGAREWIEKARTSLKKTVAGAA